MKLRPTKFIEVSLIVLGTIEKEYLLLAWIFDFIKIYEKRLISIYLKALIKLTVITVFS